MRTALLASLAIALALSQASCGSEEIAEVDADREFQERELIDAAIADLEALQANPEQADIATAAIGRYLRAKEQAREFNESQAEQLGVADTDDLPPGTGVLADDELLDPAREVVPSLFGPTGKAVAPEDLREFHAAASDDLVAAMRPAIVGPADLLIARASRYGLDATYPDRDGLTRGELVSDAATALEPYWPDLASELRGVAG